MYKHKLLIGGILVVGFLLLDLISYRTNPNNSIYVRIINKYYLQSKLDSVKDFYRGYTDSLQSDEFIMLLWIWPEYAPSIERVFQNDPFYRLYKNGWSIDDIDIVRLANSKEELASFIGMFGIDEKIYKINNNYADTLIDPVDDILFKALYCDVSGYDNFDYELLNSIADGEGGYGDTHNLLGLIFLDKLNCFNNKIITKDKQRVINDIVNVQKKDNVFGDLFAERVVMLYWAGAEDKIEFPWIMKIAKNMQVDGGWKDIGMSKSDPHATGLSALAIKYFIAGKNTDELIKK